MAGTGKAFVGHSPLRILGHYRNLKCQRYNVPQEQEKQQMFIFHLSPFTLPLKLFKSHPTYRSYNHLPESTGQDRRYRHLLALFSLFQAARPRLAYDPTYD